MFILTSYTTDREDLDLLPTVFLDAQETREDIVKTLINEISCSSIAHTLTIYSNDFEEEFDTSEFEADNRIEELKKFLANKLEDTSVNCIAVKQFGYEDVYTITNKNFNFMEI